MTYKDILVYADGGKSSSARFDVAAAMAEAHDAHLTALHVSIPPYVPADLGGGIPAAVIDWQEEFQAEKADEAKKAVDAACRRSGKTIEYRLVRGDLNAVALLHSHYADLVVLSQAATEADEQSQSDALPEEIVLGAGRPTLVVPRAGTFKHVGSNVLIAWSRTRESARAVHDALPILKLAASVTVMEVNPTLSGPRHVAGADIAAHLARHGVKADVSSIAAADIEVGDAILSRAADLGADLLVMGAYGHSRFREVVLGGVTRHILANMTVPVLMSH
jgi:nucleotide-binding universal stress UspA family protein